MATEPIDPVCLAHGLPWSANPPHWAGRCLICQLCFKVLESTADCNSLPDGSYEDVCVECAREEAIPVTRIKDGSSSTPPLQPKQPKSYILDEIHNLANHYGDEYGFDDEELTVRLWLHRVVEAAGEGGWGDERET